MDQMVLKAQRWVNATYGSISGYVRCAEDGSTGWATMYSLTRALQHELGITALSDSFGPTTLAKLTAYGNVGLTSSNMNMRTIAEAALYGKGYSGGDLDGSFGDSTQVGLTAAVANMGIGSGANLVAVEPKIFKALLTMDAYILVNHGDSGVQAVQRWLNGMFYKNNKFFIGPCDGHYSRSVQVALVQALQYSLGLGDAGADGNIGGGTEAAMKAQAQVSTDGGQPIFVQLFRAAMTFNNRLNVWQNASTAFTTGLADSVRQFQEFCKLEVNGKGDYATWMSLLLSTGDPDRKGLAIDVMYPLNSATIATVKAAGYQYVGRYLTGGTNKVLTNSEIALILDNGMSFFPLFQEYGNAVKYFSYDQGVAAGNAAFAAARAFTIPAGSVIYFSVDFDALDTEIAGAVIPHFQGINSVATGDYAIGVYGCRNVCLQLEARGLTSRSFVSGMSWGYSGNLGYSLPANWAFDQISNRTIGSGAGALEIDNDIASGADPGVNSVSRPRDPNDGFYTYLIWLEARAGVWRGQGHTDLSVQELVAQYLRMRHDLYDFDGSAEVFGELDRDWLAYVKAQPGRPDATPLRDPLNYRDTDIDHFGASFGGVLHHELFSGAESPTVGLADFGGWGGDLLSVLGSFCYTGLAPEAAHDWAMGTIASNRTDSYFDISDWMADVDAVLLGATMKNDLSVPLSTAFHTFYSSTVNAKSRYLQFFMDRFGGSMLNARDAAMNIFIQDSDLKLVTYRNAFWNKDFSDTGYPLLINVSNTAKAGIAQAFADTLNNFAS